MLNKWDDVIAPHLCLYLLEITCIILFTFFILFENYFDYIFLILFIINLYFAIKVLQVRQDRNRIYKIIKSRILKKGYSKDLFKGKCDSICQLSQAIYISIRFKSISDIAFFLNDRNGKNIHYIIEDENLENILNNIDIKNVKEGQVIFEESSK